MEIKIEKDFVIRIPQEIIDKHNINSDTFLKIEETEDGFILLLP